MTGDNVSIRDLTRAEVEAALEPVSGAKIVGTLDSSLIAAFIELAGVEHELDSVNEEFTKRQFSRMAKQLEQFDLRSGWALDALIHQKLFESEEEAIRTFQLISEYQELFHSFWRRVRLHFSVWNDWLDIRQGFRVVSLGKKFKTGNERELV